MSTYETFYNKLGGYAIDGPILHEPHKYIGTVYVADVHGDYPPRCVWTGRPLKNAKCLRILGITCNEGASVALSPRGVDRLQTAISAGRVASHSCAGVFTKTYSSSTTEPRSFCPICTQPIRDEQALLGFSENAVGEKLIQMSTVYIHQNCQDALSDVIDEFWNHTDRMLGDAL